jgi:methylenetetrahydrofolate dehydrogenase (NADP+)/methenyltetrahydrofolate cyclohydrolase
MGSESSGNRRGINLTVVMRAQSIFAQAKEKIAKEVRELREIGITPGLAAILPADEATAKMYVSMKQQDCKEVGIYSEICEVYKSPPERRDKELCEIIKEMNIRDDITGILVQMPLPDSIDRHRPFELLAPEKDVDGLTPRNKGKLMSRYDFEKDVLPCTAAGVVELLDKYQVEMKGKDVVIIGRSDLVGRPLRKLFEDRDATPVCCHRATKTTQDRIKRADIVVCAAGRPPELYKEDSFRLTSDMVKEGVVVVGVGARKDSTTGKLYFDVDFKDVKTKASYITPNLNGIGLMTRGRLLWNTILTTRGLEKYLLNPY